ncbi:hypothetical protein DOTSEDRAFT_74285 [Dothistroma septosporum NZE10]|uniref:Uncharacterized protein n=1 Tax=Dothistroma septosporum (strain NZE10 / CBS 128990) TaxID=675120 RepID=N1PGP3_DOTSN|nr:hypothetical protein DOTSEDRAFT_74285 [Dothistroma septosporum NZE10]
MSELLEFLRTHEEAFRSRSRLASLYSDFRQQRSTNPDGYTANSSAWLRALSSAAKAGLVPAPFGQHESDRFVIQSGEELLRELQTQECGRPLALGAVLQDAEKRKELIPLQDFLDRKDSIYAKGWIPSPLDVVKWGLRQLGVLGDGSSAQDRLVRGKFVVVGNVEAAAKAVLEEASRSAVSNTSRVFSKELFNSAYAKTLGVDTISRNDLDVLLRHLQRDRTAIAYNLSSGVIKFKASNEPTPSPVTPEDESIASLRTLISSLGPQIEKLNSRISELDLTARTAVSQKQLIAAKTALRQKKLADTRLQRRNATLAQLEHVYAKIEQAADQVEIVKVMEASGQTLKSLNTQTGGVEKVQDVMEELREEMVHVDEIGQTINEVGDEGVDEGEVEDELEALEEVEREKQEVIEKKEKEAKDAAEKEGREKREAEEAEKTRLRLAELDKVGEESEESAEKQVEALPEAANTAA